MKLSTVFHPQIDVQVESSIQTLEDMFRACVIDFKVNWDDHLPLIEFSYNNKYNSSISIEAFEELYDRRSISPIGLFDVGVSSILSFEIINEAMKKVRMIRDMLKIT